MAFWIKNCQRLLDTNARELQIALGYTKWYNFLKVIEKAKIACQTNTGNSLNHFADAGRMV